MVILGLVLLSLIVFFMYMWKTQPVVPRQGCSTCPSRKNT